MPSDTFPNYREIQARFASTGSCAHPIKKGDTIGYNPRNKRTSCPACWQKWKAENAAAAFDEQQYASQY